MCSWIARSECALGWHVLSVLLNSTSRKSCGPLGGHEQGGTETAAVDWAWEHPLKTASCGPLGGHEPGGTGTATVDRVWELPVEAVEKLRPGLDRHYPGGGRSMNE